MCVYRPIGLVYIVVESQEVLSYNDAPGPGDSFVNAILRLFRMLYNM